MPTKNPALVLVRGNADYANGLDRLLRKLQGRGIQVRTRHELAIYALAALASREGMKLPTRSRPHGTNRYGMPKSAFEQ
jgi:hypothetical protein